MFLIIILVVIVGVANFFYLLPPVINWDEGTHALWGFKEWLAWRGGDWHLFWQLSRAQFSYPPLGSWLIALTNLPFEFSLNLARFSSTLGFIAGGILLVLIAKTLSTGPVGRLVDRRFSAVSKDNSSKTYQLRRPPPVNALSTLFLYVTSPAILFYSVTVFKESWGMALTLLTIYLYFRAVENPVILGSDSDSRIDSGQARMTKNITIHFFLDSLLVASQLAGIYKIKEPKLKELFGGIQLLIARLNINVSFSHIPREKNYLADLEVNKALDKEIYG